jgi:uncharacterized protein (DUF433 family)
MGRKVVSLPLMVGGSPTLEGTRMTCANVSMNLNGLGLEEFRQVYPYITIEDIRCALQYCAEQRCVGTTLAYCQWCSLRPVDPDDADESPVDVWLLSAAQLAKLDNH